MNAYHIGLCKVIMGCYKSKVWAKFTTIDGRYLYDRHEFTFISTHRLRTDRFKNVTQLSIGVAQRIILNEKRTIGRHHLNNPL